MKENDLTGGYIVPKEFVNDLYNVILKSKIKTSKICKKCIVKPCCSQVCSPFIKEQTEK